MNPYTAALLRQQERVRSITPGEATPTVAACSERVSAFFDALEIGHGGNRARVCTGIAHTMCQSEIDEAISRIARDDEATATMLEGLGIPAIIVTNARRKGAPATRILERARPGRPAR